MHDSVIMVKKIVRMVANNTYADVIKKHPIIIVLKNMLHVCMINILNIV